MTLKEIISGTESKMKRTVDASAREFSIIRTGRASGSLVEGIMVDYYGANTPLKQMASISIPDPRLIMIQPWDKTALETIEKAILKSNLGITPNNDGKVIRISIPSLTTERKEELDKVLKKIAEDGRISIRTARRDANEDIKKLEKDKAATEDEKFKALDDIQKMTDKHSKEIDELLAKKEKEIQG
ncbi:MAG: ribosome recycling factor [Candidatus Omnitrophota bacterium]